MHGDRELVWLVKGGLHHGITIGRIKGANNRALISSTDLKFR